MGGDCGSWTDQQRFDGQIPDFDSTSAWIRQYMESQNLLPNYMYPWHATTATGQDITLSSTARPQSHIDNDNGKPHNQFLVFDQTGDQTTMIFSSGVGAPPVHRLSHWKVKQAESSMLQPRQDGSNMVGNADAQLIDDFIEIRKFEEDLGSDLQSEMHEDTEELNALMYSDGDTDSDDDEYEDEVTSTCHSPSTLKIHDKQSCFAEIREKVASSDEEPTKRRKLSNGGNEFTLADDHIIVSHGTFAVDDDTGSHCGSAALCNSGKAPSLSGKKRSRKDRIRERVRTLQSMIPCGNSANPIEVIDEAINFLLSLKLKAKSVGFDSTI